VVLVAGSAEFGDRLGLRLYREGTNPTDVGTLAGAALGLLALLVAFSFSMAVERYDTRRTAVLEEANAIGSTANFALMLPGAAQPEILRLLRDYTEIRAGLGFPYDPAKMQRDIARSLALQSQLWQQAIKVTAAEPQSLPAYRFVASLNEMNNVHERRLTALRNAVPIVVLLMLLLTAMVAMGFTGYNAGTAGARRRSANVLMAVTIAVLIGMIIDLNRPTRGFIEISPQALVDALQGLPQAGP
jgi:hypothetical protein